MARGRFLRSSPITPFLGIVFLAVCFSLLAQAHDAGAAAPTQAWVARYNGLANLDDQPAALKVDKAGNVYVIGASHNNAGADSTDWVILKYLPNGTRAWVKRLYTTGADEERPTAMAVDAQGNVYVTGYRYSATTYRDYVTLKYNTAGTLIWSKTYVGTGGDDDIPYALALDPQGNVYVTGSSLDKDLGWCIATIKYNAAGTSLWVKKFNPAGSSSEPRAMAVDPQGNVYVTGVSLGGNTGWDYLTLKYDTNGNLKWSKRYAGANEDSPTAIALDVLGNVYVTGYSFGSTTREDYLTIKYDNAGNQKWAKRLDGTGHWWDVPAAMAVDAAGNVYITGTSDGATTDQDFLTAKYDTNGLLKWSKRYNNPPDNYEEAKALALDNLGNVYVTGYSGTPVGNGTFTTIKYGPDGSQLWLMRYNGPEYGGTGMALAVSGQNVYVAGASPKETASVVNDDILTIKYSQGANGWMQNPANGHSYKVVGPGAWQECENLAVAEGAHLVTIRSLAEQNWLVSKFGSAGLYWIGLTDKVTEGVFKWISGETLTYQNWSPGEPNNGYGNEDYVAMNWGSPGKWNDCTNVNDLFLAIIEKKP
jgi:uncharacterized delta-60 repeat protein